MTSAESLFFCYNDLSKMHSGKRSPDQKSQTEVTFVLCRLVTLSAFPSLVWMFALKRMQNFRVYCII